MSCKLRVTALLLSVLVAVLLTGRAHAEWDVAGFVGAAHAQTSALHITQPSLNTDLHFHDVRWAGESFQSPLYYGVRGGYFVTRHVGIEAEFIHLKVFCQTQRTVPVDGTLRGVPISGSVPMASIVQRFSISHGDNLLMGDAVLRQDFWRASHEKLGRVIVSVRVGVGGTIPHAESTVVGASDEHYQGGSPVEQIAGGAEFRVLRHLYAMGEYKFTHNHQHVRIVGGTAETVLNSQHGVFGLAFHF